MKKEKTKGWLAVREKAGLWCKTMGGQLRARLKTAGTRSAAWAKAGFRLERGRTGELVRAGVVLQNPVLVLSLGLCAALGATTSLQGAVGMGVVATAVLLCTQLTLSLLRARIPEQLRLWTYLLVAAGFVTVADLLLQAYLPALSQRLGVFTPLLAVSSLLLARGDEFAAGTTPAYALVDGLAMGLGFTAVLGVVGAIREVLGSGSLWGVSLFGGGFHPALLMVAPCGGFLVLGALAAAVQWLMGKAGGGK